MSQVISKANSVYVLMLAGFVAGLWAILSFGSVLLHAPTDLAGRWELRHVGATEETPPACILSIQQSGRYVQASVEGKNHSLKLTSERIEQTTVGKDEVNIELGGIDLKMIFRGRVDDDTYHLQTNGALDGDWYALRVNRTYPKRQADQPTTNHAR
ncbi:MAG TPA: hypothetical protein VKK61_03530 [Tepidisphaeraceae bacterium]|nr:hypothetical protein [Tepidisphaeraceae bacterium]